MTFIPPCKLPFFLLVFGFYFTALQITFAQQKTHPKAPVSIAKQQQFVLGDERLQVTILTDVDATLPTHKHFALRFDRSATITQVIAHNRHFINSWGMPDEFGQIGIGVLGYDDAKIGEHFIKPGVGVLQMIDTGSYKSSTVFPVKQWFKTKTTHNKNQVTVTQKSPVIRGYAYKLTKRYSLKPNTGTIQIQYALTNTGKRAWDIEHYNHNFFTLDNQPLNPNWQITLGTPIKSLPLHWLKMQDNQLRITMAPKNYGFFQVNEPLSPSEADLTLASKDRTMSIHMTGNFPAYRMAWFFSPTSLCPERFHMITLQPKQTKQWTLWYHFQTVK